MANSVIITRIIEGGATLPQTPAAQRNFHNTCFIWNGAKKGEQRVNYFGTDISAINLLPIIAYNSKKSIFYFLYV